MGAYDEPEPINIGTGADVTIAGLAALIADVVGFTGEVVWDTSKPDGTRASCWMCRACGRWDGNRKWDCATASRRPTPGTWRKSPTGDVAAGTPSSYGWTSAVPGGAAG